MIPTTYELSYDEAGPFRGNILGIGQAEGEGPPETTIIGQCDFTTAERVAAVQRALGVEESGIFDETTCAAWMARYGHKPSADDLIAALLGANTTCASVVLPVCGGLEPKPEGISRGTMAGIGAFVALIALIAVGARRRRKARS